MPWTWIERGLLCVRRVGQLAPLAYAASLALPPELRSEAGEFGFGFQARVALSFRAGFGCFSFPYRPAGLRVKRIELGN